MKHRLLAIFALVSLLYACASPSSGRARRFSELAFPEGKSSGASPKLVLDEAMTPVGFLEALYAEFEAAYLELRAEDYARFCSDLSLDPGDPKNRDILMLFFLHDLLTSSSSKNGDRSGFLELPYYWHWVEPNPRHALVDTASGMALARIPPPAAFARYKSFADIDRVPALYLADLFSNERWYSSGSGVAFPTFGWCSEREMAFGALVAAMGQKFWIAERNGHVWTELALSLKRKDGGFVNVALTSDMTFDRLEWKAFDEDDLVEWKAGPASGKMEAWYNETARSRASRDAATKAGMNPAKAAFIEAAVAAKLGL